MDININGDDVNLLVYSYLQENGYNHAAFTLFTEAQLEECKNYKSKISPGQLVYNLEKSLLFQYMEKHVSKDVSFYFNIDHNVLYQGYSIRECKKPLELIKQHKCIGEMQQEQITIDDKTPEVKHIQLNFCTEAPLRPIVQRENHLASFNNIMKKIKIESKTIIQKSDQKINLNNSKSIINKIQKKLNKISKSLKV